MRFLDLNPLALGEVGGSLHPGLSTFQDGKWRHGNDAFGHCREDPQSVKFTVWEEISVDPLPLPGGMRHLADLALAQLKTICHDSSRDCWTVFTPSHWQKEQLQVFLGVAAACQMDVRMLMPRSLAVTHHLADDIAKWTVWEWHWQHLYRVDLVRDPQGLKQLGFQAVAEAGVMDFFRRESRQVAKIALESHRIDPLHSGKTEQQLFAGWWAWHGGAPDWSYQSGDVKLNFSGQMPPEIDVPGIVRSDQATAPARLKHVLGWAQVQTERDDLAAVADRLGDLSQPGARRRDWLAPAAHRAVERYLPVTHAVVNGLAERVSLPSKTRPGQQIVLQDGRHALAIHVPEE